MSAFGSAGPDAERPAYDLIAQALSGLLLAQPRPGDAVPRRLGGLALADFTAGLLAALSVVAGLLAREARARARARGVAARRGAHASGAALRARSPATRPPDAELARRAAAGEGRERLDPYYRAHACRDGLVALACLNATQRRAVCALFGLEDRCAANPQAEPADEAERRAPACARGGAGARIRGHERGEALERLAARGVPAGEVRSLEAALRRRAGDGQRPGADGGERRGGPRCGCWAACSRSTACPPPAACPAPGLDEHRAELFGA